MGDDDESFATNAAVAPAPSGFSAFGGSTIGGGAGFAAPKTGEEDEEVLYSIRSKLFVYGKSMFSMLNVWNERGIGEARILRHREHQRLRLLMRQEKTMKVIANHALDPRIKLEPNVGSDRIWMWAAFDFTDGELKESVFALEFADSDIAQEFKKKFTEGQAEMEKLLYGEDKPGEDGGFGADQNDTMSVPPKGNQRASTFAPTGSASPLPKSRRASAPPQRPINTNGKTVARTTTRNVPLTGRNPVDFDKCDVYGSASHGNHTNPLAGRNPKDFDGPTDPYGNPIRPKDNPLAGRNPRDFEPTDPSTGLFGSAPAPSGLFGSAPAPTFGAPTPPPAFGGSAFGDSTFASSAFAPAPTTGLFGAGGSATVSGDGKELGEIYIRVRDGKMVRRVKKNPRQTRPSEGSKANYSEGEIKKTATRLSRVVVCTTTVLEYK